MKKKLISFFALCIFLLTIVSATVYGAASVSVFVDGKQMQFDVQPKIVNGRTLVPMRAIFEKLGATVEWNASTRTVKATKKSTKISLKVGEKTMYVNDKAKSLDVAAIIQNDRTLVPLRAISEALDCDVSWDNNTKRVTITTKIEKYVPGYDYSVIPEYDYVTGAIKSINSKGQLVAPLRFSQSNAIITRYFYDSNAEQLEVYKEYLLDHGWTLNGTSKGGDSRGESDITGYSHRDANGNIDAQVEIHFFPKCGDVDLVTVLKRNS